MFNAFAHALLALAPEFDAAKVENFPISLQSSIKCSQVNIRKETLRVICMSLILIGHSLRGQTRGWKWT